MAGRGRAPKPPDQRVGREVPMRGEWTSHPEHGWRHGPVPAPPSGLLRSSKDAWAVWMGAWFAAHWTPDDVPGLRQVIRLYDQVERGEYVRSTELRLSMDTYGITPKGQQDRRWTPPKPVEQAAETTQTTVGAPGGMYGHLRALPKTG